MKKKRLGLCLPLLVFLFGICTANAWGQTTGFTYQGRLTDGGTPANGSYDFHFELYDSADGTNQIGPRLDFFAVPVTNGIFSVTLDFGPNAGTNNFFAGQSTGQSITTGDSNSFFGSAAGQNTADGRQNAFFGRNSGQANTNGSFNAFFGSGAGLANVGGNNNAFFGFTSGRGKTSGANNSFFGNAAGFSNVDSSNNAFFGFNSGHNVTGAASGLNSFFGASTGTNTAGGFQDRAAAVALFGSASDTSNLSARALAVRQVAENQNLANAEFNRAFVLMQYFGYLRRNPNDPQDADYTGYDFWLTKLNQFNGNFVQAEMVKAFISSIEYRQRFAQ